MNVNMLCIVVAVFMNCSIKRILFTAQTNICNVKYRAVNITANYKFASVTYLVNIVIETQHVICF